MNVSSELVIVLRNFGVGPKFCKYLWSFLIIRNLVVQLSNNNFSGRQSNKGLAQGDPLSPLVFNIVTMNLTKLDEDVQILQYADDFVLYPECIKRYKNFNL